MTGEDSPRLIVLSTDDVSTILNALLLLSEMMWYDIGEGSQAVEGVDASPSDVDRLLYRMALHGTAQCFACKEGNHTGCEDSWVKGSTMMHCACDEEPCVTPLAQDVHG